MKIKVLDKNFQTKLHISPQPASFIIISWDLPFSKLSYKKLFLWLHLQQQWIVEQYNISVPLSEYETSFFKILESLETIF